MYPKIEYLTPLDRISHTGLGIEERVCVTVHSSGRRFSIIVEKLFSFFTRPPQCPRDCFSHSVTCGCVGVHVRPIQKKSRTSPLLYDIMSTMAIYGRRCSSPSPGELDSASSVCETRIAPSERPIF